MSAPFLPPPLDHVGRRRFAFYPSILHADPNLWVVGGASWSEVEMVNVRTGNKIWVPRQYLGAVSETDDPILIVGLSKELEYREGAVWPRVKRVIEMPRAVNATGGLPRRAERPEARGPASVVGIRLESKASSPKSRVLVAVGVGAVTVSLLAVGVFADWISSGHSGARTLSHFSSRLTPKDTYASVVRRFGLPGTDHVHFDADGFYFRALAYPASRVTVILMGPDASSAVYIGTMNADWHILHSVPSQYRWDSVALLSSLPRF